MGGESSPRWVLSVRRLVTKNQSWGQPKILFSIWRCAAPIAFHEDIDTPSVDWTRGKKGSEAHHHGWS